MPLIPQILVYALVAAFSPILLVTTLTVLLSGRGRSNGLAFAGGFLAAQAVVCGVGFAIGSATTSGPRSGRPTVLNVLELVFGVALLMAAWRQGRHPALHRPARPRPRLDAVRAKLDLATRLQHLRPRVALTLGLAFGVGPKRLAIALLAVAQITIASLLPIEEAGLIVLFIAVASIPVLVPVGIYLVAGQRAEGWVVATKGWMVANQTSLTLYSTAVFGLLFVIDGLVRLL